MYHSLNVRLTLISLQLLFSVVVLGLSVSLAKGQGIGKAPAETGYAAFTGAFGIIAALVGIVALFVDSLDGVITWLIDGVASLALLVGGIVRAFKLPNYTCLANSLTQSLLVYAVTLKGVTAVTPGQPSRINSSMGMWSDNKGDTICYWDKSHLHSRCVSAEADTAFMFLAFIACIALLSRPSSLVAAEQRSPSVQDVFCMLESAVSCYDNDGYGRDR